MNLPCMLERRPLDSRDHTFFRCFFKRNQQQQYHESLVVQGDRSFSSFWNKILLLPNQNWNVDSGSLFINDTCRIPSGRHAVFHQGHMLYSTRDTCRISSRTYVVFHQGHMSYFIRVTCRISSGTHAVSYVLFKDVCSISNVKESFIYLSCIGDCMPQIVIKYSKSHRYSIVFA